MVELAVEAHHVLGPNGFEALDEFLPARTAPFKRDAGSLELLSSPAKAEAGVEPTLRYLVKRGQLFGEQDR